MNIALWLERSARQWPDRPALVSGRETVADYRGFAHTAAALAGVLRGRWGVAEGDRVAILAPNCPEMLVAMYAIWDCGAVAVPVNAKLHAQEARFILEDCGARLVFVSAEWDAALAELSETQPSRLVMGGGEWRTALEHEPIALVPRERDDLAWLFYTSGTTGKPKGAMLTHGNLTAMTLNYFVDVDPVLGNDSILHAAPVSHGSGLYNFAHVLKGAAQIFPASGGFDADEVIALLQAHRGVTMFAAPTMVMRLADRIESTGAVLPGLKTIVYGGGPMYVSDRLRAMRVFGPRLVEIYGQGETPMTISVFSRAEHANASHPARAARLASVGVPMSVVEVSIRGEDGSERPACETGEVCVKGPTVMAGYWNHAEASARALRNGWLWTGDLGTIDADGFLSLKDRSKDLIISGGSNIYPREVEEALLLHPAVAEVSVIGLPDAEWGERVVAVIVAKGAAPEWEALDAHCLQHIARFKRPKAYRFVESLPKNNTGKVLKTALRAQFADSCDV
ncbi:MAG: AMP-binding protein [Betaproteobacteria bacterium]|nr:AMP-binding protein [Betaproteobacteria bacterium]